MIVFVRLYFSVALIIAFTNKSHLKIPPKMLTKIDSTFASLFKIFKAATISSPFALPPTSRKLAGVLYKI